MAKIYRYDELEAENPEKGLYSKENKALIAVLEDLPARRRKLVIQMLALTGDKTFKQMCEDSGYAVGPNSKVASIKKEISGILGPALFEAGFTEHDIVAKMMKLWNAKKQIPVKMNEFANGQVVGNYIEIVEVEDNALQEKMLKTITQLGDYFPAKKLDIKKRLKGTVTHELTNNIDIARKRLEQNEQKVVTADYEIEDNGQVN